MIENLKYKKMELFELWDFLKHNVHQDFYLTEDNRRIYITQFDIFKKLIKQSYLIFVSREFGEVNGVIMVWRSRDKNIKRNYVKISSKDGNIANKLITILLWNHNKDLYLKMNKYSPYLNIFKQKNFYFRGDRGREVLLIFRQKNYDKYDKTKKYKH